MPRETLGQLFFISLNVQLEMLLWAVFSMVIGVKLVSVVSLMVLITYFITFYSS